MIHIHFWWQPGPWARHPACFRISRLFAGEAVVAHCLLPLPASRGQPVCSPLRSGHPARCPGECPLRPAADTRCKRFTHAHLHLIDKARGDNDASVNRFRGRLLSANTAGARAKNVRNFARRQGVVSLFGLDSDAATSLPRRHQPQSDIKHFIRGGVHGGLHDRSSKRVRTR